MLFPSCYLFHTNHRLPLVPVIVPFLKERQSFLLLVSSTSFFSLTECLYRLQAWRGALKVLATKENGFTGTNILALGAAEEFFARMQVGRSVFSFGFLFEQFGVFLYNETTLLLGDM